MSQIIKPEGIELIEYLNEGYAICNKCGAVMDRREHPRGGNDIYTCMDRTGTQYVRRKCTT